MKSQSMFCLLIAVLFIFIKCQSPENNTTEPVRKESNLLQITVAKKSLSPPEEIIVDTGQVWYKVTVSRNDTTVINYEGNWPVLLTTKGFATLAMTAKKGALVISHGLTLYMYDWPSTGRLRVVSSVQAKGDINMILMPAFNDQYGLAISPDSGFVEMKKNDGKIMSGNFEAHAKDGNKNIYRLKGYFLNVKPH